MERVSRSHWILVASCFTASVTTGACNCQDDVTTEMLRCEHEGAIKEPSAGFPSYGENPDDGSPPIEIQLCDSKAVDLNGDGLLDFVAADHISPGFGYFMQEGPDGDQAFAEGVKVTSISEAASNSAGIVAADFNGDGIPDIANSGHEGVVTIRTNGTPPGSAISDVIFPADGETNVDLGINHSDGHGFAGIEGGLVQADFNGDGKLDIATANLNPSLADGKINSSILINTTPDPGDDGMGGLIYPPASSFAPPQNFELPAAAISISRADFNDDGMPDIATTNVGATEGAPGVSVLTNTSAFDGSEIVTFTRTDLVIPSPGNSNGAGAILPATADFNKDGKTDVATANWNVDTVTIFTNTTASVDDVSFTTDPVIVDLCFNPLILRTGDLDGDGDEDMVVVPMDIATGIAVGIIENLTEVDSDIPQMALVDIVYLPERMQEQTFLDWVEGERDGESPSTWFASTANVADFDNDGKLDIVAVVAHAGFTVDAQAHLRHTDNILEYVVPPVPLKLANMFLPKYSELIQLVQD